MKDKKGDRRTFLKSLLAGSAVAAGVATSKKPAQAKGKAQPNRSGQETLYRETDAFKDYYTSLTY